MKKINDKVHKSNFKLFYNTKELEKENETSHIKTSIKTYPKVSNYFNRNAGNNQM